MNQPKPALRIKSIKVTRLFGLYDHQVTLKAERVTVIHGPNGVGKTVFLNLTDAFLCGRYYEILRVPFDAFEVCFTDNSLARIQLEGDTIATRTVHLSFTSAAGEIEAVTLKGDGLNISQLATRMANYSRTFGQVADDEWIDKQTNEVFSSLELITRVAKSIPEAAASLALEEPKGLRELRDRLVVHFIETERLTRQADEVQDHQYRSHSGRKMVNTIHEYSRELAGKLNSTFANYAMQSQKLDQTFPQRLLKGGPPLTIAELKRRMQQVAQTREWMQKIGILEAAHGAQDPYLLQIDQLDALQPEQLAVMSVYVSDTEEKLAALEELSGQVNMLLTALNSKFINKKLGISHQLGLVVHDCHGKAIPLVALSTGEQHALVILYTLLFRVKPNTLVLIDEPELSLHISWQKRFMDDLLDIIRLAQFDVIMATHSPYIVGDHSELLVVLSPELET